MSPLWNRPANRPSDSWGFTLQGRMTPAGRVRLRPNRGFPRRRAHDVTPYGIGRPIDPTIQGVHVTRQDDAGSPGSGGASPYHHAAAPMTSPPMELVGPIDRAIRGGQNRRSLTLPVASPSCAGLVASSCPLVGEKKRNLGFTICLPIWIGNERR
jgi:hypothetical protein